MLMTDILGGRTGGMEYVGLSRLERVYVAGRCRCK